MRQRHTWPRVVLVALLAIFIAGLLAGLSVFGLVGTATAAPPASPPLSPTLPAPNPSAACTSGAISGYGHSLVVAANDWVCGDADAYGGSVTVDGHVSGTVSAFGGSVVISGQVDGNVVAVGGDVVLEPGAHIGGDVQSWGGTVRRAAGALVSGTVERETWVTNSLGGPWQGMTGGWLFPWPWIVGWSLLAALIVTLVPERTARVGMVARRAAVRSVSVGLLTAVLGLVLAAVLFATCLGIPISLLVVMVLVAGWVLGTVAVGMALGGWLFHAVAPRRRSLLLPTVVGVALLSGLESVPCVGAVVAVVVSSLGLGATLLSRFGSARATPRRRAISAPPKWVGGPLAS